MDEREASRWPEKLEGKLNRAVHIQESSHGVTGWGDLCFPVDNSIEVFFFNTLENKEI